MQFTLLPLLWILVPMKQYALQFSSFFLSLSLSNQMQNSGITFVPSFGIAENAVQNDKFKCIHHNIHAVALDELCHRIIWYVILHMLVACVQG